MINERQGFFLAIFLYSVASLAYLFFFTSRKVKFSKYGTWLARAGLLCHTLALTLRTLEASRLPLTNQYEFATSFAWGISLTFIAAEIN